MQPEMSMMYAISGESFFMFTNYRWICNWGALCHITNNDTGMYDITDIKKLVQYICGNIKATEKGKLHAKVREVDRSKLLCTL